MLLLLRGVGSARRMTKAEPILRLQDDRFAERCRANRASAADDSLPDRETALYRCGQHRQHAGRVS
jgi:hypothetical protein